jgi:hypothetical protein
MAGSPSSGVLLSRDCSPFSLGSSNIFEGLVPARLGHLVKPLADAAVVKKYDKHNYR